MRLTSIAICFLLLGGCIKIQESPEAVPAIDYSKYYKLSPDIENCYEGVLKDNSKLAALNRLNFIRGLHKLPPVIYDAASDTLTQKASLIGVANSAITHYPDLSSYCYSADGNNGCGTSNLALTAGGIPTDEEYIDGWIGERNSASIGHRRWMLSPFLKFVSYGRVDGKPKKGGYSIASSAALKVVYMQEASVNNLNLDFIAYPYGSYPSGLFPKDLFLSFSAFPDKSNSWGNGNISFSAAVIEVKDNMGSQLQVSSASYDNNAYGLPNSLQWKVTGLKDLVPYTVIIRNVRVGTVNKDFTYSFTLVN